MEIRRRGLLLPLTLLLLGIMLTAGQPLASAPAVFAQAANSDEANWLNTGPGALALGSPSHGGVADANPAVNITLGDTGLNGYCVQPTSSTIQPASGAAAHWGFSLNPDAIALGAAILSSDGFTNATTQSNDDFYCVVIKAQDVEGTMTLSWAYTSGGELRAITFTITVFQMTFRGWDGMVGGSAAVCTVGWDESIMRGRQQMLDTPGPRDPANDFVEAADWEFTLGTPAVPVYVVGEPYQKDGEWCIAFAADSETRGIGVRLNLVLVYDLSTRADNFAFAVTRPDFIDILDVNYSEFRHINLAGQIDFDQIAGENVINSMHRACIVPSDNDDVLNPSDVIFNGAAGDGPPTVHRFAIFHALDTRPATGSTANPAHYIPGVRGGTKCIEWTSNLAGEQAISAKLLKVSTPTRPETFPGERFVNWDSNGDSNPDADDQVTGINNGALVKKWKRVSHTVVTLRDEPFEDVVTNSTVEASVQVNAADGTYIFNQTVRLTEWVYGEHLDPRGARQTARLDGAIIVARIGAGACGHFISERDSRLHLGTAINGISFGGRFDRVDAQLGPDVIEAPWPLDGQGFDTEIVGDGPDDIYLSITNDPGCNPGRLVRVTIDVFYPGLYPGDPATFAHREFVDIKLVFVTPQKQPRLAWVGEIVTIEYGFATGAAGCGDAGSVVHAVRSDGQPGNFIPDPGITVTGADHAYATLGADCEVNFRYESEQSGEVDVEIFLFRAQVTPQTCLVIAAPSCFVNATKIAYPIFYMAIEDVTLSVTPEMVVSELGDVSAWVRGYFVGTNPSGREATITPDGRYLPANRWVLPDDWEIMAGDPDTRTGWGSIQMPLTDITFWMVNEPVRNSYQAGVKNGAAGWFVFDGTESSINISPYTQQPSALGSETKPRIITDLTDQIGLATVDFFGDLNLSYEECELNVPTGNPHCAFGDVVGRTQFYATAEYPHFKGQTPAIRSTTLTTVLTWGGYKTVTIEPGDSPTTKFVVLRMRDRDGFCDALGYNNALGIPVEFFIETNDGIFLRVAGPPTSYNLSRTGAKVWSYDTLDNQGNPVNVEFVRPFAEGVEDECQVWVEVSHSLSGFVDVRIFLPDTPGPIPGELRITNMICEEEVREWFTVTNLSDHPMTLEGWALQGEPIGPQWLTHYGEREHLQLSGILQPGESKTFFGGPKAPEKGWINANDWIHDDDAPRDYVELIWNQYVVSRAYCPTETPSSIPDYNKVQIEQFPITGLLPTSGEGPLILDVVVPFGQTSPSQHLVAGWNLIGGTSSNLAIRDVFAGDEDKVSSVYTWDNEAGEWKRYIPGAPDFVQTLTEFTPGLAYWVFAREPFTLSLPQ